MAASPQVINQRTRLVVIVSTTAPIGGPSAGIRCFCAQGRKTPPRVPRFGAFAPKGAKPCPECRDSVLLRPRAQNPAPSAEIRCFCAQGAQNKELPPSSRRQAAVHRTVAFHGSNPGTGKNKNQKNSCPSGFYGPSAEIRTRGLLNPIQARYQTSPHPDFLSSVMIPHFSRFCKHFF